MEYVKGEPITVYCDRHRLATAERLELFIRVCEGVQHAHQKGIIHRDLKPSNVLVTIQDDHPVPKIIDFGVAKATAQPLTEHSLFTELGAMIGTPEYMSPEQAEMGGLDIDTRTDVYALGVMLYELLTGSLPFDRNELRRAGLLEIQRTIREKEPPRPSTRVTQLGPASTEAAHSRHTEPARLASDLRGDLDWITMKALEKDRTRRYDTATGLANDVRRHLRNEPVSAGPPSAAYRAGKFARRHRFGVGVLAAVALLTVGFATVMAVQAARIARERDRANREAERANREAAAATQVADFLTGLFSVSDPAQSRGRAVSAREVLDKGAARIGSALMRDPVLQGRLLFTMGDVYRSLGALDEALQLLERSVEIRRRALGPESPDTLRSASLLGFVYDLAGRTDEAEKILTSTYETERRVLGEDHPNTLKTLHNLAGVYDSQGRYEKSVPMMRDVFERRRKVLGADSLDTLGSQYNLAVALYRRDAFGEAERVLKEVAASFTRVGGADHPSTLIAKDLLAGVYEAMKRPADARRVPRGGLRPEAPCARSGAHGHAGLEARTRECRTARGPIRRGRIAVPRDAGGPGTDPGPRSPRYSRDPGVVRDDAVAGRTQPRGGAGVSRCPRPDGPHHRPEPPQHRKLPGRARRDRTPPGSTRPGASACPAGCSRQPALGAETRRRSELRGAEGQPGVRPTGGPGWQAVDGGC